MIIIQDYKVHKNGKWLIINLIANPALPGTYIESLRISCDGSFTDSASNVFDALIAEQVDFSEKPTSINITLDIDTFKGPFYMLVVPKNDEGMPTTCAYRTLIKEVTFYKYPLYKTLACLAKELDGCEPPQHFVDFLLRLKALEASIKVYDEEKINYYYNWFILHGESSCQPTGPQVNRVKKPCGCGR